MLGISLLTLASILSEKFELRPEPRWHYLYVAVLLGMIFLSACRMSFKFQAKEKRIETGPNTLVKDPDAESIEQWSFGTQTVILKAQCFKY